MTSDAPVNSNELLIDRYLPVYDVAITEHLVIEASTETAFTAAKDLDFLTVRSPLLTASFLVRGLPARLSGQAVEPPARRAAPRVRGLRRAGVGQDRLPFPRPGRRTRPRRPQLRVSHGHHRSEFSTRHDPVLVADAALYRPRLVVEGAIVVAGDDEDPFLARVVDARRAGRVTKVHLEVLPGDPADYVGALRRAHLL